MLVPTAMNPVGHYLLRVVEVAVEVALVFCIADDDEVYSVSGSLLEGSDRIASAIPR